jgi:hypothetical protein
MAEDGSLMAGGQTPGNPSETPPIDAKPADAPTNTDGNQAQDNTKPIDYTWNNAKSADKIPDYAKIAAETAAFAKELGLTKEQFEKFNTWSNTQSDEIIESRISAAKKAYADADAAFRKEYGQEYDAKIDSIGRIVDHLGDDFRKFLNETGAGNDPRVIRAFIKLGELISPDTLTGTGGSGGSSSEPPTIDGRRVMKFDSLTKK